MRQLLNISILILLGSLLSAQTHQPCGFHPGTEGFTAFDNDLAHHVRHLKELGGHYGPRDVEYVPISFHVGRATDNTGGVRISRVLEQLCELNEDFAPYDIQFFLAPVKGINIIANTSFYENHSGATNFMNIARNPQALNVFIPENANIGGTGQGTTLAYYNIPRDWIVVGKSYIGENDATLSHEIGHYFNLEHTFNGWEEESYNVEGVPAPTMSPGNVPTERENRTNCETAGDRICDTREDYNNGIGWPNCTFTLNVLDPLGNRIDPEERNYMSYFLQCPDDEYIFSDQQNSVMQLDLNSSSRNYLRANPVPPVIEVTEEVTLLSPIDGEELDFYNEVTLEWQDVPGADAYFVETARNSGFSIEYFGEIVYGTSKVFTHFEADRRYYWRVRPFNAHSTCIKGSWETLNTGTIVSASEVKEINTIQLIPNPTSTSKNVQVYINSEANFEGNITITDLSGRQLNAKQAYNFAAGEQNISLDISSLSAGLYLVNIQTATGRTTEKLVITQ